MATFGEISNYMASRYHFTFEPRNESEGGSMDMKESTTILADNRDLKIRPRSINNGTANGEDN